MKKVEFYEFLGRCADQLFETPKDEDIPLSKKLGRLLTILIEKFTRYKCKIPNIERDLDTDSDDEDEQVE